MELINIEKVSSKGKLLLKDKWDEVTIKIYDKNILLISYRYRNSFSRHEVKWDEYFKIEGINVTDIKNLEITFYISGVSSTNGSYSDISFMINNESFKLKIKNNYFSEIIKD